MAVDCSAIMKQSPRVPALSSGAFQPHIPYEVSAEMNINSMSWGEAGSQLIRFAHFNLLHQEVSLISSSFISCILPAFSSIMFPEPVKYSNIAGASSPVYSHTDGKR